MLKEEEYQEIREKIGRGIKIRRLRKGFRQIEFAKKSWIITNPFQ